MSSALGQALQAEIDGLKTRGLWRDVVPSASIDLAFDFTSNDYLGLARHPALAEACAKAAHDYGTGAKSSRLLGGGSPWDARAEDRLAEWLGAEAALLFPTGYQANLGLVTSLAQADDVLFCDANIHASMIDACRLSKAGRHIFAHNSLGELERRLETSPGARRKLVLVEALYSMDGDKAPLEELNELCDRHDAWLLVDEAHSIGVCGDHGEGLAFPLVAQAKNRVLARVVTGGKALGCAGGFIVGSSELRELLIQRARSFIFSTGIAPPVAASLHTAIGMAREADAQREALRGSVETLAVALGREAPAGPILPFIVGQNEAALELATRLQSEGYEVRAVRPPTVPEGTARLRVVLHAGNTPAAIEGLAKRLNQLGEEGQTARAPAAAPPTPRPRRPFAIVGTDTDIGKTIASAVVAQALSQITPVTYWKPVQTGEDSDTDTVRTLTSGARVHLAEPAYEFPLAASPHEAAAAADSRISLESLVIAHEQQLVGSAPGQLLIELAGGLLVPYDDRHTQVDWLSRTQPRILLVARSGLGTLNHTLLTVEALRARRLEPEALLLVGPTHTSNRETLRSRTGIERIVELPHFSPLTAEVLRAWLEKHPMTFAESGKP